MEHKILVIDDKSDERSVTYQLLEKICTQPESVVPEDFIIKLIFAKNYWQIDALLQQHSFSAVILDVVLTEWKRGPNSETPVSATDVLRKLDEDVPVALLSSEWISGEVKDLIREWPARNCRMFIHWDELASERLVKEGSISRILFGLKKHIEYYRKLDYSIPLGSCDPIRILHISDMQFGGFNQWKLGLEALHCATTIMRRWTDGPTFLAVTGDISERGLPVEFEAAFAWLSGLVAHFNWRLPTRRIMLVPGNHDVCLSLAAGSLITLAETQESQKARKRDAGAAPIYRVDFSKGRTLVNDLLDFGLSPYMQFAERVASRPYLLTPAQHERGIESRHSLSWLEAQYRQLGVVFLGLNTARPINAGTLPGRTASVVAIEDLVREAQKVQANGPPALIVGLSHHSPLSRHGDRGVQNPAPFEKLFSDVDRVGLWLHGHWHKRETIPHIPADKLSLIVNTAPSLTVGPNKRPPDTLRGFSMIELARANGIITGCSITPVEYEDGKLEFRPSREFTANSHGYMYPKPAES